MYGDKVQLMFLKLQREFDMHTDTLVNSLDYKRNTNTFRKEIKSKFFNSYHNKTIQLNRVQKGNIRRIIRH